MQPNSNKLPTGLVLFAVLLIVVVVWILFASKNCLYANYSDYFDAATEPMKRYVSQSKISGSNTSTLKLSTNNVKSEQFSRKPKTILNITKLEAELTERLKKATEKKLVVIWQTGIPLAGGINPERCGNCEITHNKTHITDNRTAAVVVYFTGTSPEQMPPLSSRNPNHLYVFWTLESSASVRYKYHRNLIYADEFGFNATCTYRRDSDFPDKLYWGNVFRSIARNRNKPSSEEILKQKTKKGLALVSDCKQHSVAKERLRILKNIIATGYELEGYGGCFPENGEFANGARRERPEFYKAIRAYKFYFSFENSYHCKDYITEKFFKNAFVALTVPVVWGATKEDYLSSAPPGSFIFVEDYQSLEELVEYLNYLDKNDTAYLQYFAWHTMDQNFVPEIKSVGRICQLCRALYGINFDDIYNPTFDPDNHPRPIFDDKVSPRPAISVRNWTYYDDNKECFDKYF